MSSRSQRRGIGRSGACDLKETPLLVRGDIVSCEMADGSTVEFPKSWGLVHDTGGGCVHECEIFVCPYTVQGNLHGEVPEEVHNAATDYWGEGYKLLQGFVELPNGPWDRVGRIVRVYYDRYGELASPYQHPFKQDVKDAAILYRQRRAQKYGRSGSHKAYRISLPDGCVINAHGFVWP
jgi:hypothetical protein